MGIFGVSKVALARQEQEIIGLKSDMRTISDFLGYGQRLNCDATNREPYPHSVFNELSQIKEEILSMLILLDSYTGKTVELSERITLILDSLGKKVVHIEEHDELVDNFFMMDNKNEGAEKI